MSTQLSRQTFDLPRPPQGLRLTVGDRLFSAEQLLLISADTSQRYELQKGILTIMSPAGGKHGALAMRLGAWISVYAENNDLGIAVAAETGFRLESNPDTVLAPDAAFIACERLEQVGLSGKYYDGPPDLLVEVNSPGDRPADVAAKVELWLHHGAKLVWIVDPASETVTVHRADGSTAILTVDDTLDGEAVLPGFRYPLNKLFT